MEQQQATIDGSHQNSIAFFEQLTREGYLGIRVIRATRLISIDSVSDAGCAHGLRQICGTEPERTSLLR